MSCSNCFNGCAEIVSDKCVKYTGVNVPSLGISYGDTLLHVENQLVSFISSIITGSGINISIPDSEICALVRTHLPLSTTYGLDDVLVALIKSVCDIKTQTDALDAKITALNADYTIGCLTGVTASSDTHDILQATITKLCSVNTGLIAFIANVNTNYVKIADLDSYIAAYISSGTAQNKAYARMIPYSPIPYVGALSGFPTAGDQLSTSGPGVGYWEKVYLCNGLNGTPDLRGRTIAGAISGVGGGPLNPSVDPSNPFNPNYGNGTTAGSNYISLSATQIPSHTHAVTDGGHTHAIAVTGTSSQSDAPNGGVGYPTFNSTQGTGASFTNPAYLSVTAGTANANITIGNTGGGEPHANNQPAYGTYYIMYIP